MGRLKRINLKLHTASKDISRIASTLANKKYLFK